MGHYDDFREEEYAKERMMYRINAAKTWNELEDHMIKMRELCKSIRQSSRLKKAFQEFENQTILWRYEEQLLEDSDLVLDMEQAKVNNADAVVARISELEKRNV